MNVAAKLNKDRIMLQNSWIAKALGVSVEWDAATQTVTMKL